MRVVHFWFLYYSFSLKFSFYNKNIGVSIYPDARVVRHAQIAISQISDTALEL